ncbi:prepilin-type N-terminal cleavage/methylation domain-containing protein [Desulfuromonas acetoxidans]|uniref:pilus assembly FimT family protein n=1 Tax=Desulfuromonas acetoxidans TaxID=891 RepID=UPI00292E9D97|nr:prepilin-type N-terminal cleavage/methylation domain-containing protein [Desulfuromonas acetoxidans]
MNQRGFTLVELLVTIAIFGILLGFAIPATKGWRENAADKEVAREILTWYRQARSEAVTNSQLYTVTLNLDTQTLTHFNGDVMDLSRADIEAHTAAEVWKTSGLYSVTFYPKGSCSIPLFIRVNKKDALTIRLDSTATGLARM